MRLYRDDGKRNEDWFGYMADVLAPCDAVVESVRVNPVENTPGSHTNKPAGGVIFKRDDGVRIAYGHVADIQVAVGDRIVAGQVIGKCGNNGTSWMPHIHVGAWKENEPLQIVVDLKALGEIQRKVGDSFTFLVEDEETKQHFEESFRQ